MRNYFDPKEKLDISHRTVLQYRPGQPILDFDSTYIFIKNLQFLPNDYETRPKLSTQECLILTEFHNQWVKIVDFLRKAFVL